MKPQKVFIVIFLLFILSCNEDDSTDITGVYQRNYNVDQMNYLVQLTLTNEGLLKWEPLTVIPGHSASEVQYVLVSGKQFRIYNDSSCKSEAVYDFILNENSLNLSSVNDSCLPRKNAMTGIWDKQ